MLVGRHALRPRFLGCGAAKALRRLGAALGLASSVGVATLGGSACNSPLTPGGGQSAPCPAGTACQTRLTLLHTSDIHSRLYPYDLLITKVDADLGLGPIDTVRNVGGVARMGHVLGRERARAARSLHLDSGDVFQGAPIFNFYSGEPEVRALTALGTDAAVIGNHEFDRGALNITTQFQRWAGFRALAANYKLDDPTQPQSPKLATIADPFEVFDVGGLKVAAIGMGNLSSLTSIFDQPNRSGIEPLNTVETAQFYIDLLRPYVDVIVMVTHLGLEVDQRMVRGTSGIDVVLGGHNHIVLNPPQEITDCAADPINPGYVWVADPDLAIGRNAAPPNDAEHPDPINHPFMRKRACKPRRVFIVHSGAFSKYVGRLDLVLSDIAAEVSPTGDAKDYDLDDKFEVVSAKYQAIPIEDSLPEDPVVFNVLEPYRRTLDVVADLDILAGYAPQVLKRSSPVGGDSPLGNLVGASIWLRLGVQTDFALTNTTGIRTDLNPGPVSQESMYNLFPFDNSISKMQLSGKEVRDLFDFVARRSALRGCNSQAQIAGVRVRINCAGCTRPDAGDACTTNDDCPPNSTDGCDTSRGRCRLVACAEQIFIGHTDVTCEKDEDCANPDGSVRPGVCDKDGAKRCMSPVQDTNLYELATSNYLAGGGSGYRVLQRNTTQFDTKIQQRDALIDYIRQGRPCGWKNPATAAPDEGIAPDGLKTCATDADCGNTDYVCACPGHVSASEGVDGTVCTTDGECGPGTGRCVLTTCRNEVAAFHERTCADSPQRAACKVDLNACELAGEQCKFLSCVDRALGGVSDNRVEMLGR
jgi:5'-nucleotidase